MYSAAYVWAKIVGYMEQELTSPVVSAWFDDAEVLEFTDTRLVIYSPTEFRRETIKRRGLGYVKAAMRELFDLNIEVEILGDEELDSFKKNQKTSDFLDFNPQFTFDKFVVGASNRFAHAYSLSVAKAPGQVEGYNPLFIYAPPGLGKTHLLYAIASYVRNHHENCRVVYVKAEEFTNELIQAIQNKTNVAFREKYRAADVLLIDDIQFIAGKESAQEEYFNTFNELYEHKKQIVMTSDRPPKDMAKLEERLRTRFEWGLTVEITPPDYETRMAILQHNAMDAGLDIPQEVLTFIAENITSDIRKLEGAVNALRAATEIMGVQIDMEFAKRVLKNIKSEGKSLPTPDLILAEVCNFYSIEVSAILSNQKTKVVAEARMIAMYLLDNLLNYSTNQIGSLLNRDHTTVMYGLNKIKNSLKDRNSGLSDILRDINGNIDRHL